MWILSEHAETRLGMSKFTWNESGKGHEGQQDGLLQEQQQQKERLRKMRD